MIRINNDKHNQIVLRRMNSTLLIDQIDSSGELNTIHVASEALHEFAAEIAREAAYFAPAVLPEERRKSSARIRKVDVDGV